jgi:hypothetical protein
VNVATEREPRAAARWLALGLLALAFAATACALHELFSSRVALVEHWGVPRFACLVLFSCICVAIEGLALRREWRERSRGLFVARAAFDVVTSSVAAMLLFFQPARGIECAVAVGLAGGVVALLALLEPPLRRRAPRTVKAVDFAVFQLCLAAWCAEAILRAKQQWRPSALLVRADAGPRRYLDQFHLQPGQMRFGFPCDSRGYYDEETSGKRAGEFFALALGDSFSVSVGPHALHFTTVCERELGDSSVYNMGVPAIGPPEYFELLRSEGLALRPDAIVVSLFIGNDVAFYDTRTKPVARGLVPWFDANRYLLGLFTQRVARMRGAQAPGANASAFGDVIDPASESGRRLDTLEAIAREYPWLVDVALERPSFPEETFRNMELARIRAICRPDERVYGDLFEVLSALRELAPDTPLYVLLIPDEFQVEDAVWDDALSAIARRDFERDLPQRRIVSWLAEHGIEAIDLLPAMRAVEPMPDGRRHLYHLRNTHFNTRGNDLAGKELARALRPLKDRVLARERAAAEAR